MKKNKNMIEVKLIRHEANAVLEALTLLTEKKKRQTQVNDFDIAAVAERILRALQQGGAE